MLGAPAEVVLSALDMARAGRFAEIHELFATPLRPLVTPDALVRQFRYLASLRPENAAAAQPAIDALEAQARRIDDPAFSPSTPASQLPLGAPASYWLDLRDYDPPALAAALGMPMLILQGARDYQVTVAEDLARWQAALADHPEVTIRVYPEMNHLFAPGSGPSSPAEYEPAQHVDATVVADIASWLTDDRPR